MSMMDKYRVWCLSWDEDESDGHDVMGYDPLTECPTEPRHVIWLPFYNLDNGREAAEAYADYVWRCRDGHESTWPLKFRVRIPEGTTQDFEVDLDMCPEFIAREAKDKPSVFE